MIKIGQQYFEIIEEYRSCFDEELFASRYSDILDKYDFIVGDFGYDQLRLKVSIRIRIKAEISKRFSSIQDYILEYCNFGCPYFVLRHLSNKEVQQLNHDEEDVILSDSEDKLHDVKIKPTIQEVKHQDE